MRMRTLIKNRARIELTRPTPSLTPTPTYNPRTSGRIKPMILLWALGVPLPIIFIILAIRSCA